MLKIQKTSEFFEGAAGCMETLIDTPGEIGGVAIVCHPNPLFGGTYQNKVTATMARTLNQMGYCTIRPNFRGVGKSCGIHDQGIGETDDILQLLEQVQARYAALGPIALAGFSFGAFVMTRVIQQLISQEKPLGPIILAGVATGMYCCKSVPETALVMHGEQDNVIPLPQLFDWARPQSLPVTVVPGADHFFSGKLHIVKRIMLRTQDASSF